jgi:DNA polymerase III gamma/tau subunit
VVQEIAIRVRLRAQERVVLAEYERVVGSVATVAALAAWLPDPDTRLVVRGRGAEPVRLETVTYGSVVEMLVVLDQRSAAVERAAAAIAALIESVRHEHVADDVSGVAGELDRLDRAAPRGRSVVERSLRTFLEGARADVLARKTTTRVRTAQALLRLAEADAALTVERVADALAPELEERTVDVALDTGSAVVVEPIDGLLTPEPEQPEPEQPEPEQPESQPVQAVLPLPTAATDAVTDDENKSTKDEKKKSTKDDKKKSKKQDDDKKKDAKKKSKKKDEKKKSKKDDDKKKSKKQ